MFMEVIKKEVQNKISGTFCDIMFLFAFLFSLLTLTLIHYLLANGGLEFALTIDIPVYHYALAVEWVFAFVWSLLFFMYYSLRGGQILQVKGGKVAAK